LDANFQHRCSNQNCNKSPDPAEISMMNNSNVDQDNTAGRQMGKKRWCLACITFYLTGFLYGLDTTIAASIQGEIYQALGEIDKLSWVGVGFPMGSVATLVFFGQCYGTFQMKWLYFCTIALFEIGSAICGAAPNMEAMIVGRVLTGVGGGGMYIGTLNYVSGFTDVEKRGLYVSLVGGFWGLGCIVGPVVGSGFAASRATWRWAFYVNLVIAVLELPLFLYRFPSLDLKPGLSFAQKSKSIDWAGFILHAAFFSILTIAIAQSGTVWNWSSVGAIILWTAVGIAAIFYGVQQTWCLMTTKENRILPLDFLQSRTQVLLYLGTATSITAFFVPAYYIPLFFQFTKGDDSMVAAVRLLPFVVVNIVFNIAAGALLPRLRYYKLWYLVSGICIVIGSAFMFTVTSATSTSAIYGYQVLIGAGSGCTLQIGYAVAAAYVPASRTAQLIRFQNVSQIGSTTIALAIAGCLFQNIGYDRLQHELAGSGFSNSDLRTALAGVQSLVLHDGDMDTRSRAVAAIVTSLGDLYGLVIAAGALMILSSLLMRWERMPLSDSMVGGL
ncbi:major facilitator superfamily domain-containing protein, partial [Penicillium macrosclerotiorum]|uniref:major facilitator superfamily domain-containing protein n=1 Tax=Penicillium macrosclerotiorum TaxID=303699 RepID=UPI002548E254